KLPPAAMATLAARPDLAKFPPETFFEIFARCLQDKSLPADEVAHVAIAGITSRAEYTGKLSGTNVWVTFNELADRGYDESVGKQILDGLTDRVAKAKEAYDADVAKRAADTEYAATNPALQPMPQLDTIYRAAAMCAADGRLFKADDVAAAVLALD